MNKYLLLRDNKQSGPYTVPEIIANGIKPYDLVWLEGKSAAWRYPSEIEELKNYAPAVEEQPFDRFYKKTEQAHSDTDHSKYVPKAETSPVGLSKKVYINFPASVISIPVRTAIQKEVTPVIVEQDNITSINKPIVAPPVIESRPQYISGKPRNNYLFYAGAAACFMLFALISYLVVNYSSQRRSISELNALVQQMEEHEKQQAPVVPTAMVDEINTEPMVKDQPPIAAERTQASKVPSRPAILAEQVVLKESKPSSAAEKQQDALSENATLPVSSENLFKLVSVKSNKYKTGVLGGISNLQLELTNNSAHELHKVAVEIKYLGPEKRIVRTQTVYFENVLPASQATLDVPKSNRGVTIDYIITDIKS